MAANLSSMFNPSSASMFARLDNGNLHNLEKGEKGYLTESRLARKTDEDAFYKLLQASFVHMYWSSCQTFFCLVFQGGSESNRPLPPTAPHGLSSMGRRHVTLRKQKLAKQS